MKWLKFLCMTVVLVALPGCAGCTIRVDPGTLGRVNTPSGWSEAILKSGSHTCYGRDQMYLLDTTNHSFKEHMEILVGGKVNLTIDFTVRCRVNTEDHEGVKKAFEDIAAVKKEDGRYSISGQNLYETFLQMKAQAIPRAAFEVQPDVATAVANSPKLAAEVRKQMVLAAKTTPLIVEDAQITNYDWPKSITAAQEELVKIQLREAAEEAQVRADLKKAEGALKVKEADKLVMMKEAEGVAESIKIIRETLSGSPEYLMWHQIKVMGEAARGPNNSFIFFPFATDQGQVRQMVANANLAQMLKVDGKGATKKDPVPPANKDAK